MLRYRRNCASVVVTGLALLASVGSALSQSCLSQSSASQLVSFWPAEGNANDAADSNNGTLIGTAGFTTGKIGQAFLFNGTTDYVNVPSSSNLNITGSLTMTAWIYLNAYSGEFAPVISKWDDINGAFRTYFLAVLSNGTLRVDVSTDGGFGGSSSALVVSPSTIPLNTWTFVAGVFNSSAQTLTVYINGVIQATVSTPFTTIFTNTRPLFIGAGDLGSNSRDFLNGRVDEAAVFSTALSAAELLCLAGGGSSLVGGGGGGCGHHTVHGHISTVPPTHSGIPDTHLYGHTVHGHVVTVDCPPHAPGHSAGLMPETGEDFFSRNPARAEPDFVAAVNSEGKIGPARRGSIVSLYGLAHGLYVGEQDERSALDFTPPATGSPLYYTTSVPEVRIGNLKADVLFSGLAPGLRGAWQINVLVPEGIPVGKVPVEITYDGDELKSIHLEVR